MDEALSCCRLETATGVRLEEANADLLRLGAVDRLDRLAGRA
jgi:hypothetical protein